MKDNFSRQSDLYAKFRPGYPPELINEIVALCPDRKLAWDCGTGNGQIANLLAPHFTKVIATDISKEQLSNAARAKNISYRKEPAENSSLASGSVDLITVAQAIHWFNFDQFYREAKRVGKETGIIAILGYSLLKTHSPVDAVIDEFYNEIVGPYWDPERNWIHEGYSTIPFPFEELDIQDYQMEYKWSFEEFIGYFNTWSAVQHYKEKENEDPVIWLKSMIKNLWPDEGKIAATFDIVTRVGKM